jgi:hypothetical protein
MPGNRIADDRNPDNKETRYKGRKANVIKGIRIRLMTAMADRVQEEALME